MKRHKLTRCILPVVLSLAAFLPSGRAQTIVGAEYFIDEDPGEGMAVALSAADGLYDSGTEEVEARIDTSLLSVGAHLLGVRFGKSDGTWSYTRTSWFYVSGTPTLIGAEWFIDVDAGQGQGHLIALPADGVWDEPQEEIDINDIDLSPLSVNGPDDPNGHVVFVRFLDSDGNWGTARQAAFQVAPSLYIRAARWATEPIDPVSQPGSGNPMQAEDGTFDGPSESIVASSVTLPGDCATIYVCVQDSLGRWNTWHGNYLDANGQWQFDPEQAYPPDSTLEFCYGVADAGRLIDAWVANRTWQSCTVRFVDPGE